MVILVSDLTDFLLSHVVMTKLRTVRGGPQPIQIAQQFPKDRWAVPGVILLSNGLNVQLGP